MSKDRHQVAGNHYKLQMEPIDFIMINGIDFCEANVIKYICRHRNKGGATDLMKAKQYIDFILEYEYHEAS